jgi:type I restriction enzyme S subunit
MDVLPQGWQTASLDPTLVEIVSGFACSKSKLVADGIAHLRPFNIGNNGELDLSTIYYIPEDFVANMASYHLESGDILFNNTNSVELVGKSAIVSEPLSCAFSNHMTRLRIVDKERLDPRWLLLCLRNLWMEGYFARNCNRWIGQAGFNNSKLAEVSIPLPPLEAQRRIVARLDALLAEVAEARRLHAAIVADTGRVMEAVRHEAFSELANRAPLVQFSEIAESRLGKMLSQVSRSGIHSRPYLRNANVLWDEFKLDDVYEMDFLPEEREEFLLKPGDLLICEGGEIGRCAVWEGQIEECYFQKALHRARLKDPGAPPRYLMHFLAWAAKNGAIAKLRTGSAIPHLTGVRLKTLDVIWPEPVVQRQVVGMLDQIKLQVAEMQESQSENKTLLNEVEHSILAQAFRGEL